MEAPGSPVASKKAPKKRRPGRTTRTEDPWGGEAVDPKRQKTGATEAEEAGPQAPSAAAPAAADPPPGPPAVPAGAAPSAPATTPATAPPAEPMVLVAAPPPAGAPLAPAEPPATGPPAGGAQGGQGDLGDWKLLQDAQSLLIQSCAQLSQAIASKREVTPYIEISHFGHSDTLHHLVRLHTLLAEALCLQQLHLTKSKDVQAKLAAAGAVIQLLPAHVAARAGTEIRLAGPQI